MKLFYTFFTLYIFTAAYSKAGNSPISFIENKGQWNSVAKYAASLPGGQVFFENTCLTYTFYNMPQAKNYHKQKKVRLLIC